MTDKTDKTDKTDMTEKTEPAVCRPGGLALTERLFGLAGKESENERALQVLDVGCGFGASMRHLKKRHPRWDIRGIDPDPSVRAEGSIETAAAESLPFGDGSLDVILMECSFSRVSDPDAALREAIRVLRPDGWLLISDMYARKKAWSRSEEVEEGIRPETQLGLGRLETAQTIYRRLRRIGFDVLEMQDASEVLIQMAGQWILDGRGEELYDRLGVSRRTLREAGCGYYFCVARPSDLWRSLRYAGERSPFYREYFQGKWPEQGDWNAFLNLPFTTSEQLRENPETFCCVPQKEIARIITLRTSGSSGNPKRLFYTKDDLLRTADFFETGMQYLVKPGERVTVYMEGPGLFSVGGLLREGLRRIRVEVTVHGLIRDLAAAARDGEGRDCFVGVPGQMYALAAQAPWLRPKTVLLSADYVPESVKRFLEETWKCQVFTHWGMTETGYGGGVQCTAREGYHLRDGDLLLEVVDPETGKPVEDGAYGELVLTTLHRRGMPLIRYRTGDLGRYLTGTCGCGCLKPRLDKVEGRLDDVIRLPEGRILSMHILDEILFSVAGVKDFAASWDPEEKTLFLTVEPRQPEVSSQLEIQRSDSPSCASRPVSEPSVQARIQPELPDGHPVLPKEVPVPADWKENLHQELKRRLEMRFQESLSIELSFGAVDPYIGSAKRRIKIL